MSQVRQAMLMLINGLKLDISHYSLFISLLKEQQSLMQQHDSDKLIQLNLRHEKLLNSISTQAERRKKIMLGIGVTADDAGMEQILNLLDRISRERVSALWQRLKILTQLCQDQNDINGQLLASQHELLNKILYPENKGEYLPQSVTEY